MLCCAHVTMAIPDSLRGLSSGCRGGAGGADEKSSRDELRRDFELYRDYLKHEDGLVDRRLTWTLTVQGFLGAAFGFSCQKLADLKPDSLASPNGMLLTFFAHVVIPVLGLGTALPSFVGIVAAHRAIRVLEGLWERVYGARKWAGYELPPLAGGGAVSSHVLGYFSSATVPLLFIVGWSAALLADVIVDGRTAGPILILFSTVVFSSTILYRQFWYDAAVVAELSFIVPRKSSPAPGRVWLVLSLAVFVIGMSVIAFFGLSVPFALLRPGVMHAATLQTTGEHTVDGVTYEILGGRLEPYTDAALRLVLDVHVRNMKRAGVAAFPRRLVVDGAAVQMAAATPTDTIQASSMFDGAVTFYVPAKARSLDLEVGDAGDRRGTIPIDLSQAR